VTDDDLIDRLIATAAARTEKVRVCARGDLVDRHRQLAEDYKAEVRVDGTLVDSSANAARPIELAEAIAEAETEMEACTVTITVATVSQRTWADLLLKHPPSPSQRREGLDHDPAGLQIAAVSACAIDPEITPLQAEQLYDTLPSGEWTRLWLAIFGLNATATPHPKLLAASELLRASEPLARPSDPAPLAGSSSAGSGER
jgi:hypothetical protein